MSDSSQGARKYGADVRWTEEDGAFVAVSPEWEGISGLGSTPRRAVAELETAIGLAIETYEKEDWPLPAPQPLTPYSGQFRVRLPRSLHAWLARAAEHEGVSLNTFVVARLSEARGAGSVPEETLRARRRA
jgi:antitoxin HicB